MRNIDKIKELEKEVGRRDKKISDQSAELKKYKAIADASEKGMAEINATVDSLLAQLAIKYGENVTDDDGNNIGYRLTLAKYSVEETLGTYEVRAQRDKDENYVVGVMKREVAE